MRNFPENYQTDNGELWQFLSAEGPPVQEPPEGFLYINQDNYIIHSLEQPGRRYPYLYTDGATSCIIVAATGYDEQQTPLVALAHLSGPSCCLAFFRIIAETLRGPVEIIARGANPPGTWSADINHRFFTGLIERYRPAAAVSNSGKEDYYIRSADIVLGDGHPLEKNRGCLGINPGRLLITNQSFLLGPGQRDSAGGIQTLFSLFKQTSVFQSQPLPLIWDAANLFPGKMVASLVEVARQANWHCLLEMTDEEILAKFSTTPGSEPAWFVDNIKQSAEFVLNYR